MPTHPCYNCGEECHCGAFPEVEDATIEAEDGMYPDTPKGCWGCYDCYAEEKEREAEEEKQNEEEE